MPERRENVDINYLSRDFNSIKNDLIEHAKRYYPDTFRDFSEAGFGALMVDAVSYIGDMLSFYVDYQANESFLSTAIEYNNVIKHGESVGYRHPGPRTTFGQVELFILVPANASSTGPDRNYMPILRAGSTFGGTLSSLFTLVEDIDFSDQNNEIVVATTDASTGIANQYAVKTIGQVVSGETVVSEYDIGDFIRFRRIAVDDNNVTEVISVVDSDGKEYFEVDHLSQNTIYIPISNTDSTTNTQAPSIVKPVIVPRRFIVRRGQQEVNIIFGYGSDSQLSSPSLLEARDVVLDLHSKNHVTDSAMDPTVLIKGDKFGIAPSNTTLFVTYRRNTSNNSNAAAGSISEVANTIMEFKNRTSLSQTTMRTVRSSLEVSNENPIQGDVRNPTITELRELISGAHSAQNRAVTAEDYKTMVLSMPSRFGGVKRCAVIQDVDSNLRNINLYVVSEASDGTLEQTNLINKENIKTWLNTKRMINDSVDILDAKVVNLGISFTAMAEADVIKSQILSNVVQNIATQALTLGDVGESFSITEIYRAINATPGIIDALNVDVYQLNSAGYSSINFNVKNYISPDGRTIRAPKNVIFEIKYPDTDIQGTIT